MNREAVARYFYLTGERPVPPPWATDCPVRFDVWVEFAKPHPDGINRRVDLILAVNEEHGVSRVIEHLKKLHLDVVSQPIAAGSFIAAKLTLAELVKAVMPMTSLWGQVRDAQRVPNLAAFMTSSKTAIEVARAGSVEEQGRESELNRQLGWFINLLRVVTASAMKTKAREKAPPPTEVATIVVQMLNEAQAESSLTQPPPMARGTIDRRRRYPLTSVTTNRSASAAATRSRTTIKADAAEQLFAVDTSAIGWAVVDSGIDAIHPAFAEWDTSGPMPVPGFTRVMRAFDLVNARETLANDALANGMIDWVRALPYVEMPVPNGQTPIPFDRATRPYIQPTDQHGTHVAGILGGNWPDYPYRGICPNIRLYDFRVLDGDGKGDEFSIVTALQAIRFINEQSGRLTIAGVNLSLAVPHDVAAHTCGWTPVCIEADRLVRSGVIVVTAAGNAGYGGDSRTTGSGYQGISISDPGNADAVITVGSTHRSNPHRHGVSYFSSRGPTADGRSKPDILAPGEDIDGPVPNGEVAAMHGTSQAAAHVSGAAAMLVARYRELLGRPERVKAILCSTATDLGRERSFQGNGLVDVLRAMQLI